MSSQLLVHFQINSDAVGQSMSQLIQAWLGGDLFLVDDRRRAADRCLGHTVKPDRLDDGLSLAMASPQPALIDVPHSYYRDFLDFVLDHPGTVDQIQSCVITCSGEPPSFANSLQVVQAVLQTGVKPELMRIIVPECEAPGSSDGAPQTLRYFHENAPDCLIVTAPTRVTRVLERALKTGISLPATIKREVDYQREFDSASAAGETQERLQQLAKQLLAQRFLLGATTELEQFVASLRLSSLIDSRNIDSTIACKSNDDEAALQPASTSMHLTSFAG
jgi:hypothetical protein